jgi:hypothetical protein
MAVEEFLNKYLPDKGKAFTEMLRLRGYVGDTVH